MLHRLDATRRKKHLDLAGTVRRGSPAVGNLSAERAALPCVQWICKLMPVPRPLGRVGAGAWIERTALRGWLGSSAANKGYERSLDGSEAQLVQFWRPVGPGGRALSAGNVAAPSDRP